MIYRTGLKFRPPLALGGHAFVVARDESVALSYEPNANTGTLLGLEAVAPTIWRCLDCHVHLAHHELVEGNYPRPCMGRVRAITAHCHIPETEDELTHACSDFGSRRAASSDLIPDSEPS
jgi:hypothetical protein